MPYNKHGVNMLFQNLFLSSTALSRIIIWFGSGFNNFSLRSTFNIIPNILDYIIFALMSRVKRLKIVLYIL
jgi:hypothetical protein